MTDNGADTVTKPSFFLFSGDETKDQDIASKFAGSGKRALLLSENCVRSRRKSFPDKLWFSSDMIIYQKLCQEAGCVAVEIHSIRVRHRGNPYVVHDIQVTYKQFFSDGSTRLLECTPVFSSNNNGYRPFRETVFELQDGEYITGLQIYRSLNLEGLVFVTNLREVRCGYTGETPRDFWQVLLELSLEASTPPSSRIVAFFSMYKSELCERVGYYAEPFRWASLGPYIVLRELFRQGRAEKLPIDDDLLHQIVQSDEGVFRHIISFCPSISALGTGRSYLQSTVLRNY